jgi:hypothetical protein
MYTAKLELGTCNLPGHPWRNPKSHPWRQRDILGESQYIHRDIWDIHGYIRDISEMFLDTYMHQNRKFIVRTRNPEPVVVRTTQGSLIT